MTNHPKKAAAFWIGLYLFFVLLPLVLSQLGPVPAPRGFVVELGVALGFVGLSMMGAQFALTARFPKIAGSLGQDTMLQFHAQAGVVAFLFVLAHPILLIAANPGYLSFFDPRVNAPRAFALSAGIGSLLLVVILPLFRRRLGMAYEWWRFTHGLLAAFVVLVGTAHVILVGREGGYTSVLWKQAIWVGFGVLAIALLLRMRILTPWLTTKRPYTVIENRAETEDTRTLVLEADGHKGEAFKPGQFAWLTIGKSPWTLEQHPFSYSSSAHDPKHPAFTIKALGDFTEGIDKIEPGTTALLEGPHGAFHPENDPTPNLAFIVGGIGVTPAMSMLRTFLSESPAFAGEFEPPASAGEAESRATAGESEPRAKARESRPAQERGLVMLYANKTPDHIVFKDELEQMREELDLHLVHVLEDPGELADTTAITEQGLITPELIERHAPPADDKSWTYYICGPEPMMNAAERALLDRGVDPKRIRSERLNIA
ncbi:MAG: ferric reductase-like transmembrane domain-containing protein [Phycisphaerales bacterium]|nr:ferric reductase-like transmembrane domain-containing protein [Phycisphaerales bacterium]